MKGIFITGTGTDIGKTFVTGLIVKKLRELGISAGYYKAALSGAEVKNGDLIPGDANYVCDIAGIDENPRKLVSFIYKEAVSPHLASKIEGNPVELSKVSDDFNSLRHMYEYITVEGSGGIVCPLRRDEKTIMLTDVIKLLNLDLIVVASAKLGTINNTVLTIHYARSLGLKVKGIILNEFNEKNYMHLDNKKEIELLTDIPVIACIPKNAKDMEIDKATLLNIYKEI